jgi:hypothetical protein
MTEDSTDKVLNVRQQKALAALLTTPTIRKAAEVSGVPEDTISRWKNKDAAFIRAYRDATLEIARQTNSDILRATPMFWNRLLYLSTSARSEAVQLGATLGGLGIIYKLLEMQDIVKRLEALEERYAAKL